MALTKEEQMELEQIYISLDKNLDERIAEKKDNKKRLKDELEETKKFFDRRSKMKAMKIDGDSITNYSMLKSAIHKLYQSDKDYYKLPDELKGKIEGLQDYLTEEEFSRITSLVQDAIRTKNNDVDKKSDSLIQDAKMLVDKCHLGRQEISINFSGNKFATYNQLVKQIADSKVANREVLIFNKLEKKSDKADIFDTVSEMMKEDKLENNSKTSKLFKDFDTVKKAYNVSMSYSDTGVYIRGVIRDLENQVGVDFSAVKSELEKIDKSRLADMHNASKVLRDVDMNYVNDKITQYNHEKHEESMKSSFKNAYDVLARELAEVKENDPRNNKKIQEIENKMKALASKSDMSKLEEFQRKNDAENNLKDEALDKEVAIQMTRDKNEERKNATTPQQLAESTMKRMISYRVGDISKLSPEEAEKVMADARRDIIIESGLTPEEKQVYWLKKGGRLPENATTADLTDQQRMDARAFMRDDEDMIKYKKYLKEAEDQKKEPTIYAEYLKFKVQEDSEMSFNDFRKMKAGISLDDSMVNTEGRGR